MIREIINIQIGQGGNAIGQMFWNFLNSEHLLYIYFNRSSPLNEKRAVYFNEEPNQKFIARSIFVGLKDQINDLQKRYINTIFSPTNFIYSNPEKIDIWSKQFYTENPNVCDMIIDSVRKESEKCDFLQGFQILHCLGGSTGSGLSCLILEKLRDEYPDVVLSTFSVLPHKTEALTGLINCELSFPYLIKYSDATFCYDNDKIEKMCLKGLHSTQISYDDLNYLIAHSMSGITGQYRFPDQINSELRKVVINHVTFPRLHFLSSSFAPFVSRGGNRLHGFNPVQLSSDLFNDKFTFTNTNDPNGVYMNASVCFRGRMKSKVLEEYVFPNFEKIKPDLSIKTSFCTVLTDYPDYAASLITNHTSIKQHFVEYNKIFDKFCSSKGFLHYYTDKGVELDDFKQARENLTDLIEQYEMIETENK